MRSPLLTEPIGKDDTQSRRQRPTEDEMARWAAAWAGVVLQSPPATSPESAEPPADWQRGVETLTQALRTELLRAPDGARRSGGNPADSGGSKQSARVSLRVAAGDLGSVDVVIERRGGRIRVLLGVRDSWAAAQLDPARDGLEQSLRAAGLTVDCIRVLSVEQLSTTVDAAVGTTFGTTLATRPARSRVANPKMETPKRDASRNEPATGKQRKRPRRGLNVVG